MDSAELNYIIKKKNSKKMGKRDYNRSLLLFFPVANKSTEHHQDGKYHAM